MATSLVLAPDSSLEEKDTREIFEMAKKMVLEVAVQSRPRQPMESPKKEKHGCA